MTHRARVDCVVFIPRERGGWGGGIGGNLAGFHDTLSLRARKRHKEWFFGIGHQLSNERRQKKDSFHFYTKNCVIKNKHRPALVKVAIFAGFYKDRYFDEIWPGPIFDHTIFF
jgi:hypothetical protein